MNAAAGEERVGYLVFDLEAVADGDLIARVRYPDDALTPSAAIARYREELEGRVPRQIIPVTFMLPISVGVAKVSEDFRLQDVSTLDAPDFRPPVITRGFWQGWRHYGRPTLVTFNGRGYDLPLLELAAFRYGLSLPDWFSEEEKPYRRPRHRYNSDAHIDLMDLLSNYGASSVSGGLNLWANLIGKPGKTGVAGSQVQSLYDRGHIEEINDYCRCDVLDTYFVFLRTRVLLGQLPLDEEQRRVEEAKSWLEARADAQPAYRHYLDRWGKWQPPKPLTRGK